MLFLKDNTDILAAGITIILGLILIFIGVIAWAGLAQAFIVAGSVIIAITLITIFIANMS